MLYITTRSNENTYTAHKSLTGDSAPDGGRFVPFRIPNYTSSEIFGLKDKTFSQTVTEMLNMFFSARLNAEDVELRIGKYLPRMVSVNHKIILAELWHNPIGEFSHIENVLHQAITHAESGITEWVRIAVRIALVFGIYGELLRNDMIIPGQTFDISLSNDDFETPMAAVYCRAMGLPVNTIVCACVDNSNLWDFFHRGTISTTLLSNGLQLGIERLLQTTLGCEESQKFYLACKERKPYSVREDMLSRLNSGLFCSVAGEDRVKQTVNSVFRSNSYILAPQCALSYTGLQDYRAKTGRSELTLLLAESTPKGYAADISDATGIPAEKLNDYINHA